MTRIATLRRSSLLGRAALAALAVGAAHPVLADEDQPAETIVVTSTRFNTDAAPAKASLDTTEPQTIINRSYIENFVAPTADYVTIMAIVPGMTGGDFNGPGLSDNGAKNTLRGLGDGNYVMQYDGIPFGDTNGPSHHSLSYFPASTIGSAVVDRGPGNAGNMGASTYGGTVKLFSQTLSDDMHATAGFTYGSFGTQLEQINLQSGRVDLLGGTKIMFNAQTLYTDGALTLNDVREKNLLLKTETPIGNDWKLTLFANYSYFKEHLDDNAGATPSQVMAYGKTFALQNTDPTQPTYSSYNWTNKQTDMDYVRLQGEITQTTHLDNTSYTYAYWNHTLSPNSVNDVVGAVTGDLIGSGAKFFGSGKAVPATDLLGYDKVNDYRVFGDILRLSQDYQFGPVAGQVRTGVWLESSSTRRYKYMFDLQALAANNTDPWRDGLEVAANLAGIIPKSGTNVEGGKYAQNRALGYAKDDEYTNWQQFEPFLEVDIKPTEDLTLTPGVKYIHWDHKDNSPVAQGPLCGVSVACKGFNTLGQNFEQSFTTTDTLPFLQANYKIQPNWSAYFEFAKGIYVPDISVFENSTPVSAGNFPAPQTTTNYQFGTVFYADQFTFDADVYMISVNNNYVASSCSYDVTETCYVNNGKALYKGIEGEGTYAFDRIGNVELKGLSLFANGAAMSSRADGGLWLPNAPRWTVAAGVLYKTDDWKFAIIDKAVGAQYSDTTNNDLSRIPSYNSVNLTAGYTFQNVEASINIDNLTDSRSVILIAEATKNKPLGFTANSTDQYYFQAPRSVMGTVKFRF